MRRESGSKTSRPWDPERYQHEAQSPAAKRPAGDGVLFLLDTVRRVDLRCVSAPYAQATRGAPPLDPALMGCLVLSAYCVGVFARRTIALACARHRAFLAIVGQDRPDGRTLSACRQRPLEACQEGLGHVVRLAGAMGLVRVGTVATEGTPRPGNASRHQAMRYGDMPQAVERLREELEALVAQADQQDAAADAARGSRRGDALPAAWARREERLGQLEAALRRWEAQAQGAAHSARQRRAAAEAARARTGTPRRGQAPQPGVEPPDAKAQRHWTDPALPRLRTNKKGWDDCGHAPASVDAPCQMSVACDVTDASNDTPQAEPRAPATLATLAQAGMPRPQSEAGDAHAIPATLENGSEREAAAQALED